MTRSKFRIEVPLPVLRYRRGKMTQQDLSQGTGISRATLNRLEKGRAKGIEFETLAILCEALECQPGDLLELVPAEQAIAMEKPKPSNGRRNRKAAAR